MKKAVVLLFFLLAGLSYSQEVQRVIVDGEITVPPGDEPEGVSIVNTTSRKATISGENGKFLLAVAAGDVITFSALQTQRFTRHPQDGGIRFPHDRLDHCLTER